MKTLIKIQKELKAPKGQYNNFGKYKYRNCEDILEAVKPLLGEATLVISDEIVQFGDRYYVKATATLTEGEQSVSATAYAREALDKKGMDEAQITGAASSYARKYALNGLFCIDDTKDADSDENPVKQPVAPHKATLTAAQSAKNAILATNTLEDLQKLQKQIANSTKLEDTEKDVLLKEIVEKTLTFDPIK